MIFSQLQLLHTHSVINWGRHSGFVDYMMYIVHIHLGRKVSLCEHIGQREVQVFNENIISLSSQ